MRLQIVSIFSKLHLYSEIGIIFVKNQKDNTLVNLEVIENQIPNNDGNNKENTKTNFDTNKCLYCGKTMSFKDVLRHIWNVHEGRKYFQCEICEKSFSKKFNVTSCGFPTT